MVDLTLINEKVCEALKEDSNEITYKAWLFFTENAQLVEENIIILVPNQFVKNSIDERYFLQIEDLFRMELEFNKLIIKVQAEEEFKTVKDSSGNNSFGGQFTNRLDEFIELINTHVKNIYDFVEAASKNGNSYVSYTLINECICGEEIYWKVKEFMLSRGFKVDLCRLDNSCILNLSW